MADDKPEQLGSLQDTAIRGRALETVFIALARCLQRDRPGLMERTLSELDVLRREAFPGTEEPAHDTIVRFDHARAIIRNALAKAEGQ